MGVEDWESKYKMPDSGVLDDYLDTEQKMWEDEDKSIIYRISDSLCESKGSRFYQTVECDALSPEDTEELNGRPHTQRHGFGSAEVRIVYKEAGSFEEESSPPEIDIIPSVKQLRQQTDTDCLLYKARLWAKTGLEDTLESYAAFCEKEAAQEEAAWIRRSYDSVGSDEMRYSFGSEEELDDLTFTEEDATYEYESYYYPGGYISPFEGQGYFSKERTSHGQEPMLSTGEEPSEEYIEQSEEYIDPIDELKSLVHSVSEYLAVKEEEINKYESLPKPVRRKLPALPTDAKVVQPGESKSKDISPEVKEDSAVEQGIAGVKNAMSSLFSTLTGSKPTTEVQASSKSPSPQPPQTDSASSPEDETNDTEVNHYSKSEDQEVATSEDASSTAQTAYNCDIDTDADIDAQSDVVTQSDISDNARTTEISSTEAFNKSEEPFSPEVPLTTLECVHTLTKKSSTIEPVFSESEVGQESTEVYEETIETSSKSRNSTGLDITPHEVVLVPQEGGKSPEEFFHKDKIKDVVLPEDVQSLDTLSCSNIKSTEGQFPEKIKRDVTLSATEPSSVKPPTEEIITSKEDLLVVKVNQSEVEQIQEQEKQGKGLFSIFSGSTATPQQTSSQTGLSILGGILPSSSTKETPGAAFLSVFGGSNAPSSSGSKDPPPTPSASHEPQGKGLFSMFGGSSNQPLSGPAGPTVGSVRPRGPPPKESPGKGLFSLFGASAAQPPRGHQGHLGGSATEKGPAAGSSIFGGILPGSTTHKETAGAGLFSKFGSLNAQPQTSPEPTGKGIFSIFGGQNQQASEPHTPVSKPPESDGVFKVSSVFSLGGNSDGNKSKTGFGLFGRSFLEETKAEPEITGPILVPEQIGLEQPLDTQDVSDETKDVEGMENVSSESLSESPNESKLHVQQTCQDGQLSSDGNSVALTDPHLGVDQDATMQQQLSSGENASDEIEASITDTPNVTSNLQEKQTLLDQETVKLVSKDQINDTVCADKEVSETNTFEVKSTIGEADPITRSSENIDVRKMPESGEDCFDKNTISHDVVKAPAIEDVLVPEVEKQTEEPLKAAVEKQTAVSDVQESTECPSEVAGIEQTKVADMEKSTMLPLEVATASEGQTAVKDEEMSIKESVTGFFHGQAKVVSEIVAEKETEESVVGPISELEKSVEDVKTISDETAKKPAEAKLELGEPVSEPAHRLKEPFESTDSVAVFSTTDEDMHSTVGRNSEEAMPSPTVASPKGLSLGPASFQPQQQPRPGMAVPQGPQGQRTGPAKVGGQQMAGPRMPSPRQPGPQKPPDPAPFSGFMSMFSSPNTQSKTSSVGGFFSSSPGSLFGPSPALRQPQQHPQQQKSSFFGLPSSIATESLTSDLFGIFKGPESTKTGEAQQSCKKSETEDPSANAIVCESAERKEAEKTPVFGNQHVTNKEDSDVPEKGMVEEAEQADKTEAEEVSVTESTMKTSNEDFAEHLKQPDSEVSDKDVPPSAPESKGMFEMPGLTAPKLSFMSDGPSSIGSLFSTTASPATEATTPQPQQLGAGLFSGFKSLSAGIFQDEKQLGKEGPSSTSSVFGMKIGSMFGNSDPPKSTPPVVTAQPQAQILKPTDEFDEPELEKLSPGSGETESADVSDAEGPTETSKTGSSETIAQSLLSGLASHSVSLAEGLDKPQLNITACEVDRSEVHTPESVHAHLDTEQLQDQLTLESAKSPPDSSRFDSSGNLSPASSQLSSELEERQNPKSCHASNTRPPLHSQPSTWDEEDDDEEEKEVHPLPEPGSNKDLKCSSVILPKPLLADNDIKTKTNNCFFEDGPPPCSPSKVRWLKAYNKVRVHLLEPSITRTKELVVDFHYSSHLLGAGG
ncbi:hypothetical protein Q5P01_015263 [Channa striata]|uniref:Uncharacterized protein n=1 Tax=Channa striata TaxID=64152 RepID=A0AA88MGZ1_CHASR|nr:hypothetical protein Q5P01_015263 [Channa striata]